MPTERRFPTEKYEADDSMHMKRNAPENKWYEIHFIHWYLIKYTNDATKKLL